MLAPYRRYGRVLKTATDRLFSFQEGDIRCEISAGAVILGRQPTDDYVRFRVPDTNCPPLPQPNAPLDSGVADEAEPNRWIVSGTPDTSNKWRLTITPTSNDIIALSYECFPGNFEVELEMSAVDRLGGSNNSAGWTAVGIMFRKDDNNWAFAGNGYAAQWPFGEYRAWGFLVCNNGTVTGGASLQAPYWKCRVGRSGSTWFFYVVDPMGQEVPGTRQNWTVSWSGPVLISLRGHVHQGSDRSVAGTVRRVTTISGAPESIWVRTPVVDLGLPLRVQPRAHPSGLGLEWRASNQSFAPGDTSPPWNNPQGEYRYWQARASTSSIGTLIERIELIPDAVPLLVWRRFRSYWQLFETGMGRISRGPFRTVFGSGPQQRTSENEWTQQSDEERNVGDW